MRMLMVSQDFPPHTGGIQTYTLELARRFAARAEELHVACPSAPGDRELDRSLGFPVHRVRGGSDMLPLTVAPVLTSLVARHRIDVLFHVQWQTASAGLLLRRAGRVAKLAIAVHGKELLLRPLARVPSLQRAYDRLRAGVLEGADLVLPVSRFSASLLQSGVSRHARTLVVPNGVDVSRFKTATASALCSQLALGRERVILTVGRLVSRKGMDSVIACLPAIAREVPSVRYVVVGEGPDRARLHSLAQRLGVSARVSLLGSVPDDQLAAWYAAADVVVLAARDEVDSVEGFGLVLLEASACGRPTVATTAGGMAEAVAHGVTGLLVPAGDSAALQQAITTVLASPALARAMGEAGRKRAEQEQSWDLVAERILTALESARPTTADVDDLHATSALALASACCVSSTRRASSAKMLDSRRTRGSS